MNIFTQIPALIWLIISSVFFAFGEFLSKKFALNPSWYYFTTIILIDIASISSWLPAIMQKKQLSVVGTIWSVLSLLITVVIGLIIFHEKIDMIKTIGIIFAFIAVVLLSIE